MRMALARYQKKFSFLSREGVGSRGRAISDVESCV